MEGVRKATTFTRREEVKAWEQDITPCEHTLCLEQEHARRIQSQGRSLSLDFGELELNCILPLDLGHCSSCEIKENLWLCLQCGNLGCGRAQFGGVGGQSHGLAHADATSHPVAVKLGSITPEGTADIYCYRCNEERTDPELATHLAHWGIDVADRQKTEKSLTEMQIEQNLRWEFSMTTEDGKELKAVFGEGFTGLKNLGNSCYLASILQCLFSLRHFQNRYYHPKEPPPLTDTPAADLETQLRKLADGLLSGRYSFPDSDVVVSEYSPEVPHQKGLPLAMLKHLIGRGHEEFSTMRQQDAFELLLHLLKLITRSHHTLPSTDPVESFRFAAEQRLQCLACKRTRYRTHIQDNISIPVPIRRAKQEASDGTNHAKTAVPIQEEFEPVSFKECLDIFTGEERVELTCPGCGSKDGFTKRMLFKTFPQVLAVNARRFELINWVPKKLDVPVLVGDESIDLSSYISSGPQDAEELLPEDATSGKPAAFVPDETALVQLEGMGFPRVRCEKALHATGNHAAEPAMDWLFEHMEDADIDTPMTLSGGVTTTGGNASVDPASIAQLGDMGISPPEARKALRETDGDVNRALDWVFSHPDDQGDFDVDIGVHEEMRAPEESKTPGSDKLPANYELQSIVCHKGGSIHAG